MASDKCPLSSKYCIDDKDPDLIQWRQVVDLDSATKLEPDWYSTKTFEAFLDALDINQPTTSLDNGSSSRLLNKSASSTRNETNSSSSDGSETKLRPAKKHEGSHSYGETILSAEALKILSELPDLSQMSATRSFIFPNQQQRDNKDQRKKTR